MDTCTAQLLHSVMERGADQLFDYRALQLQLQHQMTGQQQQQGDQRSHADTSHSPPNHSVVTTSASITRTSGSVISGSITSGFVTSGASLPGISSMATLSNVVFPPPNPQTPEANKLDHETEVDNMETQEVERYSHVDAKKMRKVGKCRVCGDEASGMYFGAMVCVPCKTFFLRYYGDNFSFVCRNQKDCEINMKTRTQCKYCRMQKCLQVGMLRRVRPSQVQISDGQQLCVVCSDLANGLHFGAITCEGCKKFFRRGLKENPSYVCKNDKNCLINPRTRNACRFCRYQKCLKAGMCREAIQMGRPSKFRHIVHNPHLPMPKTEPFSPDDHHHPHHPHLGPGQHGNPLGHPELVRGPRDIGHFQHQPMYPSNMAAMMGDNSGHSHGGHVAGGHHSPGGGPSHQLYQALKGNPRGIAPELQSPTHQPSLSPMQIKSEPPDYGYNQLSPPHGYHSPIPQPALTPPGSIPVPSEQDHINILNITSPWSQAMKTMNQETNLVISNSLLSGDEYHNAQYPLKYSTAGVTSTETTHSMTTALPATQATQTLANSSQTQSTYSTGSQIHAVEAQSLTTEDLELLKSLHEALESAQYGTESEPTPVYGANNLTGGNNENANQQPSANQPPSNGHVVIQAIRAGIPTVTSHQPSSVASESISSFKNFMRLSNGQLVEWIDFLKKERESSISPNNSTLKAIQKNSQQFDPAYWLNPALPDENIFFTEKHRKVLDQITTAYTTFVENGHKINMDLTCDFYKWLRDEGYSSPDDSALVEVDDRFNSKVVEKYTVCSVVYCKALPGFRDFSEDDQYNIVRLGQSQSRILAASSHWYRREKQDFDYFLSWKPTNAVREFKFKESCLQFSQMISDQDWDMIESAIMNSLVMVATDYSGLSNPDVIENTRLHILQAFRAYTTAKYGTPNSRIEELFSCIPHLRELGVLHHRWTMVHLLNQESREAARALDSQSQLSPSQGQMVTSVQGQQERQGEMFDNTQRMLRTEPLPSSPQ